MASNIDTGSTSAAAKVSFEIAVIRSPLINTQLQLGGSDHQVDPNRFNGFAVLGCRETLETVRRFALPNHPSEEGC